MDPLLGMYVHTHWSYNQPYAARTWTLDHWRGYLTGLSRMGYNLVQIWPMLDTMPVPPTPSDVAHLDKLRRVIEYAHNELGMTVYVGIGPNTSANDRAASFAFEDRNYFEAETLVNPSDSAAMDREMERRRVLLEPLVEADGLWVLDCDPGGFVGSSVSDFVGILLRHREILDRLRPGIRLVYWMWAGWTDKHRFDPEWTGSVQSCWVEVLQSLKRLNPEPWGLHACMPGHFKSIEQVGVVERTHFYPYNLVEYEPSYPFTNWEPKRIADAFAAFSRYSYPMGTLGNSQTHCVQIPHAYVFNHIARGGSLDNLDPAAFGERLIPGHGQELAQVWQAMSIETDDPAIPRSAVDHRHRRKAPALRFDSMPPRDLVQPIDKLPALPPDERDAVDPLQLIERGHRGGDSYEVRVERRGQPDARARFEDLLLPDHHPDIISVRHRLAERGQVGRDTQILLRAAHRESKARLDLVEDQQRAVLAADRLHRVEEPGLRSGLFDRLHDDAGDLTPVLTEDGRQPLNVVVVERERQIAYALRHAVIARSAPVVPGLRLTQHSESAGSPRTPKTLAESVSRMIA